MVMQNHIKNQLTGVLSDGTVSQSFTKSNESFNTLVYFLSMRRIWRNISEKSMGSFASKPAFKLSPSFSLEIVSQIFSQKRFTLKYSLWIFFRIFFRIFFFVEYSLWIFFRIFFFVDFLSDRVMRDHIKNQLSFWRNCYLALH